MSKEDMLTEIFNTLKTEIEADQSQAELVNDTLLHIKIEGAYRDVERARNYPSTYSAERIEADMLRYYSNIQDLARYDYNKLGAEGLSTYRGDGASLLFMDRNKCFSGVYPISRLS